MCGRFTLQYNKGMLAEIFGLSELEELQPRYNIAPSQRVAAVRTYPDGTRHLDFLHWGLIPSWAKDPSIGNRLINARSETVHEIPSFRAALRHRRCLIPANGFYEWRHEGKKKQPHYVKLKDDKPMVFAGLWEHWKSPDEEIESCTILTTSSNSLIKPLHDRMPVILHPQEYDAWLDRDIEDPARLGTLYRPYPSDLMAMYPVREMVNSPRKDLPECIEPLNRGVGTP